MDIRKPFLKSFTVKELKQFTDHYMKHRKMLHVSEHFWKLCVLVVRLRAKSVHMWNRIKLCLRNAKSA